MSMGVKLQERESSSLSTTTATTAPKILTAFPLIIYF